MRTVFLSSCLSFLFLFCSSSIHADAIRLATTPALSPDGSQLAFSWRGDLWLVSSEGGAAERLTTHPARDTRPVFSPDGNRLAFVSDRTGSPQVYVMDLRERTPEQKTFHTQGSTVEGWYPDGGALLIQAVRDHHWRDAERFFRLDANRRSAPKLLFDDYGSNGSLSPDGTKLLFTREGTSEWRKGYRGSKASQIWLFDMASSKFTKLIAEEHGAREPHWTPDGKGFYYTSDRAGARNLWRFDLAKKKSRQLTRMDDDSVLMPCVSRDGSTIVFRHLFDLYRFRPGEKRPPERLAITCPGDCSIDPIPRRTLSRAGDAAFSRDGLEIALIAGGDLWVMDTELREPRRVTNTPEEERGPVFSPDGKSILFVSDRDGQSDIWRAVRADEERYWWQNREFTLTRLTRDANLERDLKWSPDGEWVAFVKERGDLWVMRPDGKEARRVVSSYQPIEYDWSPDGKWFAYAASDADSNRNVWIAPVDGSREPVNVSRHPDNDRDPVWSPDGKMIAFTGRRMDNEVDICFVMLTKEEDETDSRDRTIERAESKMAKARGADKAKKGDEAKDKADSKTVAIDFDDIHERVRRVSSPGAEAGLFWSHDSKKLAFTSTIEGKRGTYTISPPANLKPSLLSTRTGDQATWLAAGNQIVWLSGGVPGSLSATGSAQSYGFSVVQEIDRAARHRAAFDLCWRTMRDFYYDEALNNRNWDDIRRKYAPAADESLTSDELREVVHLMLGELNGSHLGFTTFERGVGLSRGGSPSPVTAHLGVRFDESHRGPGLKVRDVIPGGPAAKQRSRIEPGETILAIDGRNVDPDRDLTEILNGPLDRDIRLTVVDAEDESREVVLRPISYSTAGGLLYEAWIRRNRQQVEEKSNGTLGYLHIRKMAMPEFYRFEQEIYAAGAGKDGLIIDVRENPGGMIADHLLTILCQPQHAITVGRGGEPGYPQDRMVYASWNKPIVVLCNQNSGSNAEIFSHAVKTLRRGQLVGVPTCGGVISTGSAPIMDVGIIRVPFRGWYVPEDGRDMELNGAVPHHVIWPEPGEMPAGIDRQLDKAIRVLGRDVTKEKKRPRPTLRKASQLP